MNELYKFQRSELCQNGITVLTTVLPSATERRGELRNAVSNTDITTISYVNNANYYSFITYESLHLKNSIIYINSTIPVGGKLNIGISVYTINLLFLKLYVNHITD